MSLKSTITRGGGLQLFRKALSDHQDGIREAVNEGARVVRNIARRSIRAKDKGGREYTRPRGEGRQKYKASAPGEAPARFSGHLVDHVRMYPAKKGRSKAVAWVGSTSPHVHLLEFGTVAMKPRPFMGPAARQAKAQNYQRIKTAAKRAVQGAARKARSGMKAARP